MTRALTLLVSLCIFVVACAMPDFPNVFRAHYKVKKESRLFKANCAVCHTSPSGGKLNLYGQDLKTAMQSLKTKNLTKEALEKVDGLDSDKDGNKNVDEIKADTLPGSKPPSIEPAQPE